MSASGTEVIKQLCEIVRSELSLQPDQVFLWNQKWDIPSDSRPYVTVRVLSKKMFGSSNPGLSNQVGFLEEQSANFQATLSVDIWSTGLIARDFADGVAMALTSMGAQKAQEKYGFLISRMPSAILDLSDTEGTAIPYRFNFTVAIQYFVLKAKQVDYYDEFNREITTEA